MESVQAPHTLDFTLHSFSSFGLRRDREQEESQNLPYVTEVFLGGASDNISPNAGDIRGRGSIPGLGRSPGGRAWQPTPVLLPGESQGQRSLVNHHP